MKRSIIVADGSDRAKILHIPSQTTTNETEIRAILKDLLDSLPESGVGLAAPQIGFNKRIFIVRDGNRILKFINPKLCLSPKNLEQEVDSESCLSIPGRNFLVSRYKKIEIIDEEGLRFFENHLARIILHETWHLGGITIDMIGKEVGL